MGNLQQRMQTFDLGDALMNMTERDWLMIKTNPLTTCQPKSMVSLRGGGPN